MSTRSFKFAGIAIVVLMGAAVAWAQQGARGGEWARYGADAGTTKYAPLDQIDKQNVSRLRIAWQRPAVDPSITARVPDLNYSGNFRATPVMIGGVLYSPNGVGLVEAFHPGTGKTLWVQEPFADQGPAGFRGTSARGIAPWADGSDRRLFVVRGEYLIALDAATGKPVTGFGEGGRIDLKPGLGTRATGYAWTGAPQICRDVVIVGVGIGGSMSDRATQRQGVPGVVQAFDVRTGKPRWKFNPDPATGRGRQRNMGGRLLVVQRRRQPLVAHQRGRRGGAGVPADDVADQRHVWRTPARQQSVRQHARVRPVRDGRAGLALPDRPSRPLGLRFAGRADSREHQSRRQTDQGGRPAHETGLCVRLRSS